MTDWPSILTECVLTSTPIVEIKALFEPKSMNFSNKQDLPTPESPTMTSLKVNSSLALVLAALVLLDLAAPALVWLLEEELWKEDLKDILEKIVRFIDSKQNLGSQFWSKIPTFRGLWTMPERPEIR